MDNTKFEVGKWYKNCPTSPTYAKCETVISPTMFTFIEWISMGKYEFCKSSWCNHSQLEEVPLSEIQQYLPEGHPDKIKHSEETFVLPNKWCVKVTDANREILDSWRIKQPLYKKSGITLKNWLVSDTWVDYSYCSYTLSQLPEYEEITFEQFEKYVLNKSKEVYDTQIKKQEDVFKKGDYIVLLLDNAGSCPNNFLKNYCFKQREDRDYLRTELDLEGNRQNGWSYIDFEKKEKWRYASKEEIEEYNRLGKPYDVTTLEKKSESWAIQLTKDNKDIIRSSGVFKKEWTYEGVGSYYGIRTSGTEHCHTSADLFDAILSTEEFIKKFNLSVQEKKQENLVGRWAKVVKSGRGCLPSEEGKIVQITEVGNYTEDLVGYKVEPKIGNSLIGSHNGFIGASSFELMPEGWIPSAVDKLNIKIGGVYWIKYNSEHCWICKVADINQEDLDCYSLNLSTKTFYGYGTWGSVRLIEEIRLATNKEKEHLEKCIEAGRYVNPENTREQEYPNTKFNPGDKVKVLRKAELGERGWEYSWVYKDMDITIGKIFEVKEDKGIKGVTLENGWTYPHFVLQLVLQLVTDNEDTLKPVDFGHPVHCSWGSPNYTIPGLNKVLQKVEEWNERNPDYFTHFKKKKVERTVFKEEDYKSNPFNQELKLSKTNKSNKKVKLKL